MTEVEKKTAAAVAAAAAAAAAAATATASTSSAAAPAAAASVPVSIDATSLAPVGDLPRVMELIGSLNHYDSYVLRMENAIQKMCDELRAAIKASWWSTAFLAGTDTATVDRLYSNSKRRTRVRVGTTGGGSGSASTPAVAPSSSSSSSSHKATATTTTTTAPPATTVRVAAAPPPPAAVVDEPAVEFVIGDD